MADSATESSQREPVPRRAPETYSARIGGLLYRNVGVPILVNEVSPIELHRTDDGVLVPSFELITSRAFPVARVELGQVDSVEPGFRVLAGEWGFAIVEEADGRVWCDIRTAPSDTSYELDCALVWYSDAGYPVMMHPDRTVLGQPNRDAPPNIAGLTMAAEVDLRHSAAGIRVGGDGGFYLIDVAFENLGIGIEVVHEG